MHMHPIVENYVSASKFHQLRHGGYDAVGDQHPGGVSTESVSSVCSTLAALLGAGTSPPSSSSSPTSLQVTLPPTPTRPRTRCIRTRVSAHRHAPPHTHTIGRPAPVFLLLPATARGCAAAAPPTKACAAAGAAAQRPLADISEESLEGDQGRSARVFRLSDGRGARRE